MASSSSKATPAEIKKVQEAIAAGESIPAGFAYNPTYEESIWRVSGTPGSAHLAPPSAKDADRSVVETDEKS